MTTEDLSLLENYGQLIEENLTLSRRVSLLERGPGGIMEMKQTIANKEDRIRVLEKALVGLLECPAIADGHHYDTEWYDPEIIAAERNARAALKGDE